MFSFPLCEIPGRQNKLHSKNVCRHRSKNKAATPKWVAALWLVYLLIVSMLMFRLFAVQNGVTRTVSLFSVIWMYLLSSEW